MFCRFEKLLPPQQGVQHTNDFCALFVHGQGVKIRYLNKAVGAHRVRGGSSVLRKLMGPEKSHILHTLDPRRIHVCGELGIAENCEPFFQAQLEPVPAGDPITGEIVEVFVGNDGLDAQVAGVSGDVGGCQYTGGIEDVEAFVLHGPHIEVIHCDDVEQVEVILESINPLIPSHRALQ